MSVGGRIIENVEESLSDGKEARRLWVVDQHTGDELAVYAEPSAVMLNCGEEIWWQSRKIMARNNTLAFEKYANSFDPRRQ